MTLPNIDDALDSLFDGTGNQKQFLQFLSKQIPSGEFLLLSSNGTVIPTESGFSINHDELQQLHEKAVEANEPISISYGEQDYLHLLPVEKFNAVLVCKLPELKSEFCDNSFGCQYLQCNIKQALLFMELESALCKVEHLTSQHEVARQEYFEILKNNNSQFQLLQEKDREYGSQLRQAQKMEAMGTLAGGIAHDFNNILTAILGFGGLIREELPEGSRLAEDMDHVLKAGNRAKELVKQILAFSRQTETERNPVQIHLIVKEALKLLRASIPITIEIRQNIDPKCGFVLADPTQIHQVAMNLCTNASHAMRESGGILSVSLNLEPITEKKNSMNHLDLSPGLYLNLEVSDTGHGMNRVTMERIFDPFFTTKEKGEGTGMGLSVVHGIVKSYGGTITVYSESGEGATFNVYLPQLKEEVDVDQHAETIPQALPRGNEHILVVDDEQDIVEMLERIFTSLGYKVTALTSSVKALKLFDSQPESFDLVITDLTMPKMTGVALAQKIMNARADIPIILCTGFSDIISEENVKALGIRKLVLKPLIKAELSKIVREVLDGPSGN